MACVFDLTALSLKRLVLAAAAGWMLLSLPAAAQTLEQMAGQMIVVGFAGDSVGDKGTEAAREEIAAGLLGGVMYLKTNVASLDAVKAMNEAFRAASPELLPFLTLDQATEVSPAAPGGTREQPATVRTLASSRDPHAPGLRTARAVALRGSPSAPPRRTPGG